MMAYFKVCPHCGDSLDPGERCDCLEEGFIGIEKNYNQIHAQGLGMGRP